MNIVDIASINNFIKNKKIDYFLHVATFLHQ